jgi:predicted nuclease of predicted toxin-antitoxin system
VIAFLWDESANEDVLRAWLERAPHCDVVTVHEARLSGAGDDEIADWAIAHDRVIVTQDRSTMPGVVLRRVRLWTSRSWARGDGLDTVVARRGR